jgi:hypothetical protein
VTDRSFSDLAQTLSSPGPEGARAELQPHGLERYEVDAVPLGKGGQGTVWNAHDQLLRREVALKELNDSRPNEAVEAAFLREARLTATLEHPGIVPVHELGRRPDGRAYYTMRRIEGESLLAALQRCATLEDRLTWLPAVVRACQAVAFAHSRHVVHRDLKPANIMLGRFGETYVVDWGLATLATTDERSDEPSTAPDITAPMLAAQVVGTPAYLSPEQALGLPADPRTDVFGLGAVLYQVLTGRPPIQAASVTEALLRAATHAPAPVELLEPGVPRDLAAICARHQPGARAPLRLGRRAGAGPRGLARRAHRLRAGVHLAGALLACRAGQPGHRGHDAGGRAGRARHLRHRRAAGAARAQRGAAVRPGAVGRAAAAGEGRAQRLEPARRPHPARHRLARERPARPHRRRAA